MRARTIPILMVVGLIAVSAAGCEQIKSAIAPPPKVNHVTIAAKVASPGAPIQGTVKKGAPSSLPFWEGAGVLHTRLVKSEAGNSWQATLATADPYDEVVAGMATGFQNAGWQVESQDASSGNTSATVLTVIGPQGSGVVTIATQKDKSTHIDYVITTSK
jgi:hypothetical protein